MKLDKGRIEGKTDEQVLESLTPDEWDQLKNDLKDNPEFGNHQTRKNLGLLLGELGITNGELASHEIAERLLRECNISSLNKTYAIVTNQSEFFVHLNTVANQ